jgi:hypothetical protein
MVILSEVFQHLDNDSDVPASGSNSASRWDRAGRQRLCAAISPPARTPERTRAEIEKNHHNDGGGEKVLIVWAVEVPGPVVPHIQAGNQHKEEEEGACHLQPDDSTHPAKGTQKSAHASRHAFGGPASGLTGRAHTGLVHRRLALLGARNCLPCRRSGGRLRRGGQALAGDLSCYPQPDAQGATDGLWFHSHMMVAAAVAGRLFIDLCRFALAPEPRRKYGR